MCETTRVRGGRGERGDASITKSKRNQNAKHAQTNTHRNGGYIHHTYNYTNTKTDVFDK